jgi:hypothetical protein
MSDEHQIPITGFETPQPDWTRPQEDIETDAQKYARASQIAQDEINQDILACFSTPAGKRVFSWLWQGTITQPTFNANLGYEVGVGWGFAREGQNTLVRELQSRMEAARNILETI